MVCVRVGWFEACKWHVAALHGHRKQLCQQLGVKSSPCMLNPIVQTFLPVPFTIFTTLLELLCWVVLLVLVPDKLSFIYYWVMTSYQVLLSTPCIELNYIVNPTQRGQVPKWYIKWMETMTGVSLLCCTNPLISTHWLRTQDHILTHKMLINYYQYRTFLGSKNRPHWPRWHK